MIKTQWAMSLMLVILVAVLLCGCNAQYAGGLPAPRPDADNSGNQSAQTSPLPGNTVTAAVTEAGITIEAPAGAFAAGAIVRIYSPGSQVFQGTALADGSYSATLPVAFQAQAGEVLEITQTAGGLAESDPLPVPVAGSA